MIYCESGAGCCVSSEAVPIDLEARRTSKRAEVDRDRNMSVRLYGWRRVVDVNHGCGVDVYHVCV